MARELGANVPDAFFQWMAGAALPSLVGLFLTPLILYKVSRPMQVVSADGQNA